MGDIHTEYLKGYFEPKGFELGKRYTYFGKKRKFVNCESNKLTEFFHRYIWFNPMESEDEGSESGWKGPYLARNTRAFCTILLREKLLIETPYKAFIREFVIY